MEDAESEVWKPISNYDQLYYVSNFGRLKSFYNNVERIIKPEVNNKGYLRVCLYKDKVRKKVYVHRIVAELFLPNPNNNPEVNHKDGNPLNNHVSNLEWVTHSANLKHAVAIGLQNNPSGENHPCAKLTNKEVAYIRANPDNFSQRKLGKMLDVSHTTIGYIQRKKTYKEG